jgi:hypothetical protein
MFDQQMELGIENAKVCPSVIRREQRARRARWWFDRMRELVEQAVDHRPALEPLAEQIWFSGAHRRAGETAQPITSPSSQEHQICE